MRSILFLLWWPVLFLFLVAALADEPKPEVKPTPSVSHQVVRVSDADARRPVETSVAINPTKPEQVVAVSFQSGRPGVGRTSNYIYSSQDGGLTWQTAAAANPDRRTQGDDAITFGPDGAAHRTYISFDGIRMARPARAATGIFLCSSRDGLAWNAPVPVVDHINSVEPFEDKPYLIVDCSKDSPHLGNIYVSWTRFDVYGSKNPEHKSHIYLARSRDGGKSFTPPVRVSDKPGDCVDDDNTVEGAVPAVGPKGEVYVAWAGPEGLVFDKSLDGGWKFGADKVLGKTPGGWSSPAEGLGRHNGLPVTAVDLSPGKDRGSIYVNWIDERHGDLDVFLLASRDGGATWSEPVRVNDDPKGNKKAQLFTWMAVDPADGSVNIVFYDRRDLEGTQTGLTLARSVDGGRTFVNHRINQEPFPTEKAGFMGDYIGVAAFGGRVVSVYPHLVGGKQIVLSAALFRFRPGTQETVAEPGNGKK